MLSSIASQDATGREINYSLPTTNYSLVTTMKIKVGDNVIVISGKNKGKTGKVLKTDQEKNRVLVEKVNLQSKHLKKGMNGPGQKIERESSIDASNVMILCPKTNKRTRVGYKMLKTGKKERFAKVSGEPLA
jgi:large subunit ribosomal protein L24